MWCSNRQWEQIKSDVAVRITKFTNSYDVAKTVHSNEWTTLLKRRTKGTTKKKIRHERKKRIITWKVRCQNIVASQSPERQSRTRWKSENWRIVTRCGQVIKMKRAKIEELGPRKSKRDKESNIQMKRYGWLDTHKGASQGMDWWTPHTQKHWNKMKKRKSTISRTQQKWFGQAKSHDKRVDDTSSRT